MPTRDDPLRDVLAQIARERAGTLRGEDAQLADAALQPSTGWEPPTMASQVFRGPPQAPSWSARPDWYVRPEPPRRRGARTPLTFTQALLRGLGVLPPVEGIVAARPPRPTAPRAMARGFETESRREG